MQFSTALIAVFAATALALPTANTVDERNFITDAFDDVKNAGEEAVGAVEGEAQKVLGPDCEVVQCAAALGPAAVGCGIAAAQGFADPLSDIPCLAAAINSVANVPAACQTCHVPGVPSLSDL